MYYEKIEIQNSSWEKMLNKKKVIFCPMYLHICTETMYFPKQQNDLTIHQVIQSPQVTHSYSNTALC